MIKYCIVLLIVSSFVMNSRAQQIIYVKKGSIAPGNGVSWATAFPDLQQAITVAAGTSGLKEIWVSAGEYKPTNDINRAATFNIPSQTVLYGGFIGNETVRTNRDWRKNRTVLSGDLGAQFDYSDNSYHIVTAKNLNNTSGVDGFIIKYGNASGSAGIEHYNSGGGMLIISTLSSTGPVINQCEFYENKATLYGGGLATISDGAAIGAQISNTFFSGNSAATGGGAANHKISGNNTTSYVNCVFSTNHASANGGGMSNTSGDISVVNCTFTKNNSISDGGGIYNSSSSASSVKNSILWENFKGATEVGSVQSQIHNSSSTPVVKNNVIQGGYGVTADKNINADPKFRTEPSFAGKYPQTSMINSAYSDPKYENQLSFNGPPLPTYWPYYTWRDHSYNKMYLIGQWLQMIDFNQLNANNLPLSTIYSDINFGKMQILEKSIHTETNRLFFSAHYGPGIWQINRSTGVFTGFDPLDGEGVSRPWGGSKTYDLVVDDETNMLYAGVFYYPQPQETYTAEYQFYGFLEWNLATNAKRWITTTSSPLSIPPVTVYNLPTVEPWGLYRLFLDKPSNTIYFNTGQGLWWWNKTTDDTGLITTSGGLPLEPGNPNLPSDMTTGMFMDYTENKFYIGTHEGLFVWDRNNNTSRIYNTSNSKLVHNLINSISKDETRNLIHVTCELGGMMTINLTTGEQRQYTKDNGNETFPQLGGNNVASASYDPIDQKLYVSIDNPGGVWIWDYNNLVPEYGDLRLADGSPAVDIANSSFLTSSYTTDILGSPRTVDYASILGSAALDAGAHEKTFTCQPPTGDFAFEKVNHTVTFNPSLSTTEQGCGIVYSWNFGDGQTSTTASPVHTYSAPGTYPVSLQMTVSCGTCPPAVINTSHNVIIENSLCGSIFCDPSGRVSIGTPTPAAGYKLSVGGKMIAEGAKVVVTAKWPDYVFDQQYTLMPLDDLKKYIDANKHLPGVPEAATVASTGVDVGEMSAILLKKTEELTLYLLQLDKRLEKINQKK